MRRKNWKRSRVVLPLLLSALMVVEPVGMATTVYAEESVQTSDIAAPGQNDDVVTDESLADDVQETVEDTDTTDENGSSQDADGQENEDASESESGEVEGSDTGDAEEEGEPSENPAETEEDKETEDGEEQQPGEENPDEETPDGENPDEETPGAEDTDNPEDTDKPEDETGADNNADDETVSENDLDEDTVSGNELEEEEENKALKGFAGMPSDYKLTSTQMDSKKNLSGRMGEIGNFKEGSDYVAGQVVTMAESQEEAEMIAEAYNAEIESFAYGVLTLKLEQEVPVEAALQVAADLELNMPAVWPNYYRHLLTDEPADGIEIETEEYDVDGAEISAAEDTSYLSVITDEYLQPDNTYYQWHHTAIGSPYAWLEGYTGKGIKVAVLDSGVASHSDLPSVKSLNDTGSSDAVGHGTHVAGIIGASANGKLGVGVAPEAELYSYNLGGITTKDIVEGIYAAAGKSAQAGGTESAPVDVINMSIGGLGWSDLEITAIEYAYGKSVAIFASAGNDGGQTYSYPACYDHVISVAATDKNNERASFSSYCNMVDLSAPGVDIWSADNGNPDGYVSMQGTSMACPVAAGEAAVILSANEELRNMTGGARVDALESLMKKNANKAGSGMGSGITSLTKVFGLSTAAVKPAAPVIDIVPDNSAAAQKVDVTITAQGGMTIYYTTNGKNPAFKNGEPDAKTETKEYKRPITIKGSTKATVKAIAVNESGVSSAVKSASYVLKPYVTKITVSGLKKVAVGKNIQLTATVTPAYATNKKVDWKLQNTDGTPLSSAVAQKLKITTGGKVTAAADTPTGKYEVLVTAKDGRPVEDGGPASAEYEIEVIAGLSVSSVKFKEKNIALEIPTDEKYDLWQHVEAAALTQGVSLTAEDFVWSSNKTSIATVDSKGVVKPRQAGKATITALAADSSGKKATINVTVTQLAEGLRIVLPANVKSDGKVDAKIAPGKSLALKAVLTPTWTTNKKVTWKVYDKDGKDVNASAGVTVSTGGKVAASKTAAPGIYTVKAFAQDQEEEKAAQDSVQIEVTAGIINSIAFVNAADKNVKLYRKKDVGQNEVTLQAKIVGTSGADLSQYTVSTSAPGIAKVSSKGTENEGVIEVTIKAAGRAAGKAKITIASTDGSNKKLVCNVTVVNPVSSIVIAPSAGNSGAVAQGKSLQLKARVESEHGAISNKSVTWELYTVNADNTLGVKVDKALEESLGIKIAANGKVTAAKDAKAARKITVQNEDGTTSQVEVPEPYVVRATAKDGSGVYGQYEISVGEAATWITLCKPTGVGPAGPVFDWGTIISSPSTYFWSTSVGIAVEKEGFYTLGVLGDVGQGGFSVSSSNPDIASVSYDPDYVDAGYLDFQTYGKTGRVTFTITAMDGSNKQVKYKVFVE